jgi:hypothetical protein
VVGLPVTKSEKTSYMGGNKLLGAKVQVPRGGHKNTQLFTFSNYKHQTETSRNCVLLCACLFCIRFGLKGLPI